MSAPAPRWRLLALVFAIGLAADQGTKFLAADRLTVAFERAGARTLPEKVSAFYRLRHLEPDARPPFVVFRPWWRMNYVENPGAAWGLFRGRSAGFRTGFFGGVTLCAVLFILWTYRRTGGRPLPLGLALGFVLTGAVGNFVDRMTHGYVVDFVEWHWWNRPDLRWPNFNVADSLITVGVVLLLLLPSPKKGAA